MSKHAPTHTTLGISSFKHSHHQVIHFLVNFFIVLQLFCFWRTRVFNKHSSFNLCCLPEPYMSFESYIPLPFSLLHFFSMLWALVLHVNLSRLCPIPWVCLLYKPPLSSCLLLRSSKCLTYTLSLAVCHLLLTMFLGKGKFVSLLTLPLYNAFNELQQQLCFVLVHCPKGPVCTLGCPFYLLYNLGFFKDPHLPFSIN